MTFLVPRTLLRRLLHPSLALRQLPHPHPGLLHQVPHPRLVLLTTPVLLHRAPHPRLVLLTIPELQHQVPHPQLVLPTILELVHQVPHLVPPPHQITLRRLALLRQEHLPQIHPRTLIQTMPLIPTTPAPTPTAESTTPHLIPPRPWPWRIP